MKARREISLSLRGFEAKSGEARVFFLVEPSLAGDAGDPTRPGLSTTFRSNFLLYRLDFEVNVFWDEAIEALVQNLGGWNKLESAVAQLQPSAVQFNFYLPIKNSDEQESGAIRSSTIAHLASTRAGLSFEFGA